MACDQGRVFINDRPAKSATEVEVGEKIHLELGSKAITVEVLLVPEKAIGAQFAPELYKVLEEIRRPPEILEWE
jgi:ribosomal 50S subunit-recycling heat shock protein